MVPRTLEQVASLQLNFYCATHLHDHIPDDHLMKSEGISFNSISYAPYNIPLFVSPLLLHFWQKTVNRLSWKTWRRWKWYKTATKAFDPNIICRRRSHRDERSDIQMSRSFNGSLARFDTIWNYFDLIYSKVIASLSESRNDIPESSDQLDSFYHSGWMKGLWYLINC